MILLFDRADSPDIFYRVGWASDSHVLYVEGENERTVYVPGFEYLRARSEIVGGVEVRKLERLPETLKTLTGPFIVSRAFPYAIAKDLTGVEARQELFPGRRVKSQDELAAIGEAQLHAAEAIALIERRLKESELVDGIAHLGGEALTSEALKAEARSLLIHRGYDCPELIVASGEQTAFPHHRGSGPIRAGPVIIDIFPRSERTRYHGDMTRTVILGADGHAQRMLAAVRKAHDACVRLCVPGAKASGIDAEARRILEAEGFATTDGEGFIHSLGHGVGLEVHEAPTLSPKSDDALERGMVVTVEPGLYYATGVRHESIVIVDDEPAVL